MSRALSNIEYATFLNQVDLDSMALPSWGGVVQWGGQYVLCYKMPSGEWALTDITDGIPYGDSTIPIAQVLKDVPRNETGYAETFFYSLPQNFLQAAAERAADLGQLATAAATVAGDTIRAATAPILDPLLGQLALPLVLVGAVLLFYFLPKKG